MKSLYCLLLLALFTTSCYKEKGIPKTSKPTDKALSETKKKQDNSPLLKCDTAIINNRRFVLCQNSELEIFVINNNNDTLLKNTDAPNNFEFIDYDSDGYQDVLLGHIDIYSSYQLALFDKKSHTFKFVEDFENFPNGIPIKNTKYYYSYTHAGCADSNWRSDLFYIDNYKAYGIGDIEGIGCEDERKTGIFIYKSVNGKEKLVKSISRKPGYYEDKWDFINDYWTKNYKLFE